MTLTQARALYRDGRYTEASAMLDEILASAPGAAQPASVLGLCKVRLGDSAAGLDLLARAAAAAPRDGEVVLNFGIGLMAAKHASEAVHLFRQAEILLPHDPAPVLNLASALLLLGDIRGARTAARKARLRAPGLAEAHYTMGLVDAAGDDLPAAERLFARAVALAPGFAEAWLNLGVTRYRRNDVGGARVALRKALSARPGFPAAVANLAVLDLLDGEIDAANATLEAALAANPDNPELRLARVTGLVADDRPDEALALLDGPPPDEPSAALHWRLEYSLALLQTNRAEEARAIVGQLGSVPPAFLPLLDLRLVMLALHDGEVERARARAETMQQRLRDTAGMLPEHRIAGWFNVARFWQHIREPGLAFDARAQGHRLLGQLQPFSRDHYAAFMEAIMAAFDGARFRDGPRAGTLDSAPVFIVGMPRSGTTLTEHILAAHRDVHGAGERGALAGAYARAGGGWESPDGPSAVAALDNATLDGIAGPYLEQLHALAPGKARIVDKMPGNFRLLGFAALLLPGARVISCVRDPRDIGTSIFQHRFNGYHPYSHDIADLGWYIARQRRLMRHWDSVLPLPILHLELTDWVRDFAGTLRRVLDFLDLPYDPACERFHQQDRKVRTVSRFQVRVPVNDHGIGRWQPISDRLRPLIAELEAAGEDLGPVDPAFRAPETDRQTI